MVPHARSSLYPYRFNIVDDNSKLAARRERFGDITAVITESTDVKKMKDRSERYGILVNASILNHSRFGVSSTIAKKEDDKRHARQLRFGIANSASATTVRESDKMAKRSQRFSTPA